LRETLVFPELAKAQLKKKCFEISQATKGITAKIMI